MKKNDFRMIDIHCHVLPKVDDGASDSMMSLQMLDTACKEGIAECIVTPHFKVDRHCVSPGTIGPKIEKLVMEAKVAGIGVDIRPGMEVFYFSELLEYLDAGKLQTLNNTDRLLVEFMPNEQYSTIRNAMDDICGAGYVPVIAHIERYACFIDNETLADEIKDLGAEIQINVSSAQGKLGHKPKKFVHYLLKNQLVDYVGTDAHDNSKRSPKALDFIKIAYKKYDKDYIDSILYLNAVEKLNFK